MPDDWRPLLTIPNLLKEQLKLTQKPRLFLLIGDPFSTPMSELLEIFNTTYPGVPVVGGMASGAMAPGMNALLLNDRIAPAGVIGLGIMGFADCLYARGLPYASAEAVAFADRSMEAVCFQAYWASTELARERGRYFSFTGSLWDRGVLPLDSIGLLEDGRGEAVEVDRSATLDWPALKARIARYGMRNSNCVAIAPTATISNIVGVSASIEPAYQNLYVKSNLSGEFTVVNEALVRDLKALDLWDEVMVADLKYFDGSLARIDRVPDELKARYATAFEIDPVWLVEAAARRQKWIDQAQSLNLYLAMPSGRKLDELYKLAWKRGLKTTYYLRTTSATQAEKSTGRTGQLNAVSAHGGEAPRGAALAAATATATAMAAEPATDIKFCAIDDPGCEACQ